MQGASKLKLAFISRMKNLTSKGIDLILALAKVQDDTGLIRGVYYKDICEDLGISIQAYYDLLGMLRKAGLICWEKNSRYDRDVQLVGNNFNYNNALSEGYINIARPFLFSQGFRQLKAKAKLLALDILRIVEASKIKSFRIGRENFFGRYQQLLSVSGRSLQVYVQQIRAFFSVCLKDGMYYFTPVKETKTRLAGSQHQRCYAQVVLAGCRRSHIDTVTVTGSVNLTHVCQLFDTYKYYVDENIRTIADYILAAIQSSVEMANASIRRKKDWICALKPKFIHKLYRDALIRDRQLEIIQ